MIPQKQSIMYDPEKNIRGDSYRTSIACVLDMQRDDIPHFYGADKPIEECHEDLIGFLYLNKIMMWSFSVLGDDKSITEITPGVERLLKGEGFLDPHYLIIGLSTKGVGNALIGKGAEVVWDTTLDDAGIIGPFFNGNYEVQVFAKLF